MGRMKSLQIHQPGYQPLYHIKPPTVDRRCRKKRQLCSRLISHTHFVFLNQTFALINLRHNLRHECKCLFIFRGGIGIDNC